MYTCDVCGNRCNRTNIKMVLKHGRMHCDVLCPGCRAVQDKLDNRLLHPDLAASIANGNAITKGVKIA